MAQTPRNAENPESVVRRVLVVEDDASIRRTCVLTLRADGWNAVGEGSSRSALERLTRGGEAYDVIVLDYAMPDLDGLALAAALDKAVRPPILLASAQADGAIALAALQLGIWDFQAKPLVPDELRRRVQRLYRRQHDAADPAGWMHRALCRCQRCAWAEALQELQGWPETERSDSGHLVIGLVSQLAGDPVAASSAFKRVAWSTDWHRYGTEIWSELARRLD